METTSICWLAVFVLLIVIELATMGLTTIWFAGGAVAGFIASMLGANVVIQAVVFFVVSIVLLIFTRPFACLLYTSTPLMSIPKSSISYRK